MATRTGIFLSETIETWALKKSLKIIITCIIKLSWNYSMFWILRNLFYIQYYLICLILIEQFVEHTKSTIEKDLKENKANASEISTLQGEIGQLQSKLSDVSQKLEVSSKELNKEQAKSRSASKHSQVHIKLGKIHVHVQQILIVLKSKEPTIFGQINREF